MQNLNFLSLGSNLEGFFSPASNVWPWKRHSGSQRALLLHCSPILPVSWAKQIELSLLTLLSLAWVGWLRLFGSYLESVSCLWAKAAAFLCHSLHHIFMKGRGREFQRYASWITLESFMVCKRTLTCLRAASGYSCNGYAWIYWPVNWL